MGRPLTEHLDIVVNCKHGAHSLLQRLAPFRSAGGRLCVVRKLNSVVRVRKVKPDDRVNVLVSDIR
jgi:hypothetical protein